MLPSETLSGRDVARLFHVDESAARRLILCRMRNGETGDNPDAPEGVPLRVRGVWLATLGWWQAILLNSGESFR